MPLLEKGEGNKALFLSDPRVEAAGLRLLFTGLAYSASGSRGVLVVGVEPDIEPKLSIIPGYLRSGRYLEKPRDIVMGDKLAGQADYQGALAHFQKQLSILKVLEAADAPALFQPRSKLADTFASLSRNADAETQYKNLLADMERAFGGDSANLSWLLQKMQAFYAGIGRTMDSDAMQSRLARAAASGY